MADNEKKKEIRQKAAALFREKGYDNVTVNEIAAAAGISKNTFYYYYENKEELIRGMFDPYSFDLDGLMGELLGFSDAYDQILCLMRMTSEYFESLGREIVRKALVMNLSRTIMERPHISRDGCCRNPLLAVFERAVQERRVRNDASAQKLMMSCAVILMGCLQMWATSPQETELTGPFLEQIRMMLGDGNG